MAAKIFLWAGHPAQTSLSHALMDAYQQGAEGVDAETRRMNMFDMDFVGIKPVDMHYFAQAKSATPKKIEQWKQQAHRAGIVAGQK